MMKMKITNYQKCTKFIIIIFTIFMIILALLWNPVPMGETDDYVLSTISLQNRFDLCVRPSDVEQARADFPELYEYLNKSYPEGLSEYRDNNGGQLAWYFGTYSASCIPIKILLEALECPQVYTYPLTNIFFYVVALLVVLYVWKRDDKKKFLAVLFLAVNPAIFYLVWQSAEVFIFSFIIMALVFWDNKQFKRAAICIGIAGTMNTTTMVLGLIMILDFFIQLMRNSNIKTIKSFILCFINNFWEIVRFGLCFVIGLVPFVYNYVCFGQLHLMVTYGFANQDGYYLGRFLSYLFDLNYGILPYYFPLMLVFFVLSAVGLLKWQRNILKYSLAFICMIAAFSIMYHINCGMSGIARYNVWVAPIMIFGVVINYDTIIINKKIIRMTEVVFGISVCVTFLILEAYGFMFAHKTSDIELTPVAEYIMDKATFLYNPLPSTFVDRVGHIHGGYIYTKPVIYVGENEQVKKILVDNETSTDVLDMVQGDEESIKYLNERLNHVKETGFTYINIDKKHKLYPSALMGIEQNIQFENGLLDAYELSWSEGAELLRSGIKIPESEMQFGPYIELVRGSYQVIIHGENFSDLEIWVSASNGNTKVEVRELDLEKDNITYKFDLDKKSSRIEFGLKNLSDEDILVKYIEVLPNME